MDRQRRYLQSQREVRQGIRVMPQRGIPAELRQRLMRDRWISAVRDLC